MYSLLLIMKKKNVKGKWAANKNKKEKKKSSGYSRLCCKTMGTKKEEQKAWCSPQCLAIRSH